MKQNIIMVIALVGWGLFVGVNVTKSTEVKECLAKLEAATKPASVEAPK